MTAGSALAGLAVAAGAVTVAGPWDNGQRTAERARAVAQGAGGGEHHGPGPVPAPSASPVLVGLGTPLESHDGAPPPPTRTGLTDALAPLLAAPALGPVRTASVVDVATGREVFGSGQDKEATPASTIKLATAVAALATLGPGHRFETTVVRAGNKKIVLVGDGDPTLTGRAPKKGTPAAQRPAALHDLADDTADALKERGTKKITLGYDAGAFTGPAQHTIGANENIAPVSALSADAGRLDDSDHGPAPRSTDPAADAARRFADLLRDRGIKVTGAPKKTDAPKLPKASKDPEEAKNPDTSAARLATAPSLPLSAIVERMLTHSDNDIAEALARQTARATGEPASFDGARKAVKKALKRLHLPVGDATFADGSGLDRADRVSAGLLSHLLLLAASPDHPDLRPAITGLPVAGFTGTLRSRYADTEAGAGAVRAKTGTLTGVNALAGTVVNADGRLLTFAFMTTGTANAHTAQKALDRLATAVANCGCR